ncbi:MAG: carbon-nitrogen hydrolase family protein [Anaerolineae bacterium]|nr:carbon-nitrogen hydrolase family protein [Anaerolineae bacterium]
MASIRVAGAQLPVSDDVQSNVQAIGRALRFAIREHADILLTPEGSLSGYTPHFDVAEVEEALRTVTAQAREAGVGLALGTCFVEPDGVCYNQIRFYTPGGVYLGFHSKTLTCGTLDDPPGGEINEYGVAPLRTFDYDGIRIGGLICNDLWANPGCTPGPDPHLSQQLARMGARIIFHAVNGGRSDNAWSRVAWRYHEANLRMRAHAGRVWVVTADSCTPVDLRCSAPSGVIAPDGGWVCQAKPKGERFFAYTVTGLQDH